MERDPFPLSDKQLYEYYYQETCKLNNLRHRFWQRGSCSTKKQGLNTWDSLVEGRGVIGSYPTEEEANQRAFWYEHFISHSVLAHVLSFTHLLPLP